MRRDAKHNAPHLPPLHIPTLSRNAHFEAIEVIAQDNLAGQAAGARDSGGEVEHVLLVIARGFELGEPVGGNDYVAGGAGHLAFAGAFERHSGGLTKFEQPRASFGLRLHTFTPGGNEDDLDHDL